MLANTQRRNMPNTIDYPLLYVPETTDPNLIQSNVEQLADFVESSNPHYKGARLNKWLNNPTAPFAKFADHISDFGMTQINNKNLKVGILAYDPEYDAFLCKLPNEQLIIVDNAFWIVAPELDCDEIIDLEGYVQKAYKDLFTQLK